MKKNMMVILFLTVCSFSYSQNIMGGELLIQPRSSFDFEFRIMTVSDYDFPSGSIIKISFGDNINQSVYRQEELYIIDNFQLNKYTSLHTYKSNGTYEVIVTAKNWIPNAANILKAGEEPFKIRQIIKIPPEKYNPISFLSLCFGTATVNQTFTYNPLVQDIDRDSLSYNLIPCTVSNYNFPPASDSIRINSITGVLTWNKPTTVGFYAIGINVNEWRNGVQIGSTYRQMIIKVDTPNSITKNKENEKSIRIFPTITNDYIYINSDQSIDGKLTIEIIKSTGQKMLNMVLENNSIQIDFSKFSNGIYFVKIQHSDFTRIEKVIKM
jgi:hypothetical protein